MFGKRSRFEKAVAQEANAEFDFEIDLGDFGDGLSDENKENLFLKPLVTLVVG